MTRMLILCRGLPASGKTTQALEWIRKDPENRARCNRDEMRQALFGVYHGLDHRQEKAVTEAQRASVRSLLEGGRSVVVDDTNLRMKYARAWADLAHELGAPFHVIDVDTDVETCVLWDKLRGAEPGGRTVGEEVIRGMAERYAGWQKHRVTPTEAAKKTRDLPTPWSPEEGLEWVWLVDIDGTVAHNDGHRGWYEYDKVAGDTPWPEVVAVLQALMADGHRLIFLSGRSDSCREQTAGWLERHVRDLSVHEGNLLMRRSGDHRKDAIVKAEIFDERIRGRYNVHAVFDDRPQVTRMWRLMGHRVFQVGDPYVEF